jgi:hypothetical protein
MQGDRLRRRLQKIWGIRIHVTPYHVDMTLATANGLNHDIALAETIGEPAK